MSSVHSHVITPRIKPTGTSFDVIVVGGGVIGCSVALHLVERGYTVGLVESATLGSEASTAALGGLTAQTDEMCGGNLRQLSNESLESYRGWVSHLEDVSGVPVEYQDHGMLVLTFSDEEYEAAEKQVAAWRQAGVVVRQLTSTDIFELEPHLSTAIIGGYHIPSEHLVDPVPLMHALAAALSILGCTILLGKPVVEVVQAGGSATGVKLSDGQVLTSSWVVIAAGAWSGLITGIPYCPVEPVRGQAVLMRYVPQPFKHHIYSSPGYIVPRADGRLIVGATWEQAGYDKRVTAGGIREVLSNVMRVSPLLEDCEVIRSWSGLRPRASDGLPILGATSRLRKLAFATAHFSAGIALAPGTGRLIADIIDGRTVPAELSAFSPDRFGGTQ